MTELSAPLSSELTGVDLLLSAREAEHYLRTAQLPELFPVRLQAFVRYSVCQSCDYELVDEQSPSGWCQACCNHAGQSAFARHYRSEPSEGGPRVRFDSDHAWRREDPLSLNEALWYLETGELPADFFERVVLVADYGCSESHPDPLVRGSRIQ